MVDTNTLVEVTQADRVAAADYLDAGSWYEDSNLYPDSVRSGGDDQYAIVQAFARHRTDSLTSLQSRVEELTEALTLAAYTLDLEGKKHDCPAALAAGVRARTAVGRVSE